MIEKNHGHHHQPPPRKCPRCHSSDTKFCYYNNYSLSQPRYYCKACRRYWTHGGTLRNVPVGGGSRKTSRRKASSSNIENQRWELARNLTAVISSQAFRSSPAVIPLTCNSLYPGGAFWSFMAALRSQSRNQVAALNLGGGNGPFLANTSFPPLRQFRPMNDIHPSQQRLIPPAQLSYWWTRSLNNTGSGASSSSKAGRSSVFSGSSTDGGDPAGSCFISDKWFGHQSMFNNN